MKAGYHVELATSDYHDEKGFEESDMQNCSKIPNRPGILVTSLIQAIGFSVASPLIQRLLQKTLPVEGLTLGDEPSIKTVKNYIEVNWPETHSFQTGFF